MAYHEKKYKCMKCGRVKKTLYYCDDCGGIICNDCIITKTSECSYCRDCGHFTTGNKCEKCGKTNDLTTAKKIIRKCPRCSSIKIKYLSEKISDLPEDYKATIDQLNDSLVIIKDFADSYAETVNKAKIIRREKFGLYPDIETSLIRIQNNFYDISSRSSELLEQIGKRITKDARNLTFQQNMPLENLRKTDRTIKNIQTHIQSYLNLIKDYLKNSQNELNDASSHLKELDNYSKIFDQISKKFKPKSDELKIAVIPSVRINFPDSLFTKKGTIIITNKTFYFIQKRFFGFRKEIKAIPLMDIIDVDTKSSRFFKSKLYINLPNGKKITLKCTDTELEKLHFLFGVVFHNNEGYVISDPYLLEELQTTLNYSNFKSKLEKHLADLKEIPYRAPSYSPKEIANMPIARSLKRGNQKIKKLQIELRALKNTKRQLDKSFNDRSITPEVYFPRLERINEKIYSLEQQIIEAKKYFKQWFDDRRNERAYDDHDYFSLDQR
ncbi:MAG: hypothetical protein U9O98_01430 [Asgard group archaeon]|nr:hypothetical protein [Asgard group archaeon]